MLNLHKALVQRTMSIITSCDSRVNSLERLMDMARVLVTSVKGVQQTRRQDRDLIVCDPLHGSEGQAVEQIRWPAGL